MSVSIWSLLYANTMKWCRIIAVFAVVVVTSCHGPQKRPSSLLSENEVLVPITDAKIRLRGFIAGGSYSENQNEAIKGANSACSKVFTLLYHTLDHYRMNDTDPNKCGKPFNENPFEDNGFLYVYRPEALYTIDPGDVIVEQNGPNIVGDIAPYHSLWQAFESFNEKCFKQIESLKEEFGSAMIAATCGDGKILKTMTYSPDHHAELPNLQVMSQMKIFKRKGYLPQRPDIIALQENRLFSLPDLAQAIASVGPNSTEAIISTFAGSVTKVDLKNGKKLWEKNLTNPSVTSVRETTGLNTVAVSQDQKWVAVGGDYGYLALLNGHTGTKIKVLSCDPQMFQPLHYQAVSFSIDQRSLLAVSVLGEYPPSHSGYNHMKFPDSHQTMKAIKITLWNTENFSPRWTKEIRAGNILEVGFDHSQNFVIVVASDKVILLSEKNGDLVREFPLAFYEGDLAGSYISGAIFSEDMRLLAISSFSGVTVIESQSSKILQKLRAPLKFELGRPEFISSRNQVRAYDAYGNVFLWDLSTGNLRQMATASGLSTNYNGPATMPLLSLAQGQFLVQTQSMFPGLASYTPRAQPASGHSNICREGPDADLPALELRSSASLVVWSAH